MTGLLASEPQRERLPTLRSNSTPIPFDDSWFAPMRESTQLLGDRAALRQRLAEDGYLLLRGLLSPADVWRLRAEYFALFPPEYLAAGTAPEEGIYSGHTPRELPEHGVAGHPAYEFVRSTSFDRFISQPALTALADSVIGATAGGAVRAPRVILRHFDRACGRSSRAHTDLDYMRHGGPAVITVWIPVGDCPVTSGGLVYLADSHRLGPDDLDPLRSISDRPGDDRPLSHDLRWVATSLGRRWLWTDFRAGDVALHVPTVVHAALDTTTDAMRVSVDIRYGASIDQIDHRWLALWAGDDGA